MFHIKLKITCTQFVEIMEYKLNQKKYNKYGYYIMELRKCNKYGSFLKLH